MLKHLKAPNRPEFDYGALVVVEFQIAAPGFVPGRELGHESEYLDIAVRDLDLARQCAITPRVGAESSDRPIIVPPSVARSYGHDESFGKLPCGRNPDEELTPRIGLSFHHFTAKSRVAAQQRGLPERVGKTHLAAVHGTVAEECPV